MEGEHSLRRSGSLRINAPKARSAVRLLGAAALVALGVLCAALALLAIYVRTTALDDGEARSLARQLIARPDIRAQVAATSVDRLYAYVNVAGLLRRRMPAASKPAAGPLAAALRGTAEQGIDRLLLDSTVQSLWTDAVYRAHRQLVRIVENKRPPFPVSNGKAVLDLRPLVLRAGERLGLGVDLAQRVPPNAGRITIFASSDLKSAQQAIRILNFVANWFWGFAIASWVAALLVGRREPRRVLRWLTAGLVAAGIGLLAVRAAVGHVVVHSLVAADWARPVVSSAWGVVTARLADSAWTTLGVGVVALLGLWLQGSSHARRVRSVFAPLLRSFELGYGTLAVLLGLLVWWGPTIETRELPGILLIAAGAAVGFELLRRTTAREFPEARLDDVWEALRVQFAPPADEVSRLERLARLHQAGELSDEEFAAAKRAVLGPTEGATV
jgi:hypothetical protein